VPHLEDVHDLWISQLGVRSPPVGDSHRVPADRWSL